MNDKELEKLLSVFNVPDSDSAQIESVINKANGIMLYKTPTKTYSIFIQLKTQASYLSKWFYLCSGFLTALCVVFSFIPFANKNMADVYVGFAPLFVIPCVMALYQTFNDKMFELEAACKYNLSKILAGKMLLLGSYVIDGLICSWLIGSVFSHSLDFQPIFFAFVSFSITCTAILWFGKKNITKGFIAGSIWAVVSTTLKLWDITVIYFEKINIGFLFLIFLLCLGLAVFSALNYLKNMNTEDYINGTVY